MDEYDDASNPLYESADQSGSRESSVDNYTGPVQEVGPKDLGTPPGEGHTLTIRQSGRDEQYRYGANGQLNQEDASVGEARLQNAVLQQQLRQHPYSHADELRLQRLESGRASIERDLQAGTIQPRAASYLLGLINSGSSELQARKEARLTKEEEDKLNHWNNGRIAGRVGGINDGKASTDSVAERTRFVPHDPNDPDKGGISVYTGWDGKEHIHQVAPKNPEHDYDAAVKALTTKDDKGTHTPSQSAVIQYMKDKAEALDIVKGLKNKDPEKQRFAEIASIDVELRKPGLSMDKKRELIDRQVELLKKNGGETANPQQPAPAPPAAQPSPPAEQFQVPKDKKELMSALQVREAEQERRRKLREEQQGAAVNLGPGQMSGNALGVPGGGRLQIQ